MLQASEHFILFTEYHEAFYNSEYKTKSDSFICMQPTTLYIEIVFFSSFFSTIEFVFITGISLK